MGYLENAKQAGIETIVENYKAEMLEKLTELVAIPSLPEYTTEDGLPLGKDIIRALHYALELSEKLGFRTHNENDNYGWAEVGEGEKLVCIFVHLDIVPVGDGWTKDPFVVSEENGWLYGRGILDNKGPAIACMYALKACCDVGSKWPCRVRIWFGTNEETGMNDIQMYMQKYGAPDIAFVPDSQFPLSYSELGTTNFLIRKNYCTKKTDAPLHLNSFRTKKHANGITPLAHAVLNAQSEEVAKEVCCQVEAFAKERQFEMSASCCGSDITIEAKGKVAAHWNEPWTAVNALARLILFLDTVSLGEDADTLIHFVASKIGEETDGFSLGMKAKTETAELSLALEDAILDEFGLAFHFFMIAPAELRVENLLNTVLRQIRSKDMKLIVESLGPAMLLDKESKLIKTLYSSYSDVTGNTDPIKVCGGTYSKFIPNAVPFGAIFSAEKDICHVPDEKIEISDLINWAKIYSNALLRIADGL